VKFIQDPLNNNVSSILYVAGYIPSESHRNFTECVGDIVLSTI